MTENFRFGPSTPILEVLLTGEEWLLRNAPGAGYIVVRTRNQIDIYLPDLKDAFEHKSNLNSQQIWKSPPNRQTEQWFIKDKKYGQTYRITNGKEDLIVYQQSKYEILTLLFEAEFSLTDFPCRRQIVSGTDPRVQSSENTTRWTGKSINNRRGHELARNRPFDEI